MPHRKRQNICAETHAFSIWLTNSDKNERLKIKIALT